MSRNVSYPVAAAPVSDSGSSDGELDETLSDWASSLGEALHTKSLFSTQVFPNQEKALAHDLATYGFDLSAECKRLELDVYGRMRLINWIRKTTPKPEQIANGSIQARDFESEEYLLPVISDDPLLQLDFDDWSDDDEVEEAVAASAIAAGPSQTQSSSQDTRIQQLEQELERAKKDVKSLQTLVQSLSIDESEEESAGSQVIIGPGLDLGKGKGKGKDRGRGVRDDDTHYFDSYAENDIHEVMLRDTTRTVSYARFILSNPQIFRGAIVMDVGCGTGILSMFAAKAGAKHVYAIEASGLAVKARANIAKNGFAETITVIQGKVEDIELPVKHVDVIVSEWMGYMLLYESMLDSVLAARDRFLAPSGLMVPSQTRLVISGITATKLHKDMVNFWDSVYGFDMSVMNSVYLDDGLVELVDAEEIVTDEFIVRDVNAHDATPKSLDFKQSFTLRSTSSKTETIRAFLTHFDTFFSPIPGVAGHVPPEEAVEIVSFTGDEYQDPVAPIRTASATDSPTPTPTQVSFTTGPRGKATHWKQVAFLLSEPIVLEPQQELKGVFHCRKSSTNSRELDVEIHYTSGGDGMMNVRMYRVR